MTPERKAQMALAVMGAMIERIKLQTAMIKGDMVGIATHAKGLAQHQAKAIAASMPAPDPQRTITVPAQGNERFDASGIVDAFKGSGFKVDRV